MKANCPKPVEIRVFVKFKYINVMKIVKEFTAVTAKRYVKSQGQKTMKFYFNIYGYHQYLTLERTFATPSGNLKEYPSTVTVKAI